jgi:transcriptional regulator with XRE-family HTH domain
MMERSRSTPLPALAAHRRKRGLTQRQLGELAGVAHTTVQQLESLKRGVYPQTLRKLATALGVAPEELLHGERAQPLPNSSCDCLKAGARQSISEPGW